jgi:GTP-binding protein YchF
MERLGEVSVRRSPLADSHPIRDCAPGGNPPSAVPDSTISPGRSRARPAEPRLGANRSGDRTLNWRRTAGTQTAENTHVKIGLVGYQGSGKSTLFEWLTGVPADPSLAHTLQTAMATVPDERLTKICGIYHPKKVVEAAIELVDTPGLSRTHEGSAQRLSLIREAACLVLVTGAFDGSDPWADATSFEEDVLLADLELVSNRIARLKESVKKPRPNREKEQAEIELLEPIVAALGDGQSLRQFEMTDEQRKVTKAYQLITRKPRLVLVNTADDEDNPQRFLDAAPPEHPAVAVPVGIELELARMTPEDRKEFEEEMGLTGYDRGSLLRKLMDASGQMLFFTASEKEVRSWMITKGTTAVEAAGGIHSDLARGFIRAETMACDDLIRLGSEREIKAAGLMRQEPKDYVIKDGDVVHIKFNV